METRPNLQQKLQMRQRLILSPKQQQSMKILCMPVLELHQYLQTEIAENVFLEFSSPEKIRENDDLELEIGARHDGLKVAREDCGDFSNDDYDPLANYAVEEEDLYKYLNSQLSFCDLNKNDEAVCVYIINSINQYGYLETNIEEISEIMNCSRNKAEAMLKIVRSLDPPGIASENLASCLLAQLDQENPAAGLAAKIITSYLNDLAHNRISLLSKKTGATVTQLLAAKELILKLNPYPGLAYARSDSINYCYPDIIIKMTEDKPWIIVNDSKYSSLQISDYYKRILSDKEAIDPATYKYLRVKYDNAKFLLKAICQRRETLYKIAESIVQMQPDYFRNGGDLLPMNLKDVAELAGVHESTVSRAISGKYLEHGRGLTEIKKMFSQSVNDNEAHTARQIKSKIKSIITNEDARKPISDQKIMEMLEKEGICLARRTVAKYREELGIFSTAKRKRY